MTVVLFRTCSVGPTVRLAAASSDEVATLARLLVSMSWTRELEVSCVAAGVIATRMATEPALTSNRIAASGTPYAEAVASLKAVSLKEEMSWYGEYGKC